LSDLSDLLLTGLLNHGSLLLGLVLFLAAFGVPLPATMLLLAAGAFARQGVLPWLTAALAGMVGAVLGDFASYEVGRQAGQRLPARLTGTAAWREAAERFSRWGVWAVFFSRFLLTPIALPINLLAGSTGFAWGRFALAVLTGEAIWVLLFGGLGAVFAGSWEALSALAGDVAGLFLGAVVAAFGLWRLWVARRARPQPP
jgi:membrane protein DedA with SNARE-associated domain